ncbi:MAG: helix-turn-helix domain-containing protein [Thermoleophilaceae bacterium]
MKTGTTKQTSAASQPQVFKALSHPLRHRLLAAMSEREASPSELAAELGEPLGNVAYHVRMLETLGCIELVRTTPRRGALEHHYRAIVRAVISDEDWEGIPESARQSISAQTLGEIWRDVAAAMRAETFDRRTDRHLSWTNLTLDEQGWEELTEALGELFDRALSLQAESAARLAEAGSENAITSKLALMHYEAASAGSS